MKSKKVKKESYLKGVKKEIKNVSWPTKKDVFKYTVATVVFIGVVVGFFIVLNLLLAGIIGVF